MGKNILAFLFASILVIGCMGVHGHDHDHDFGRGHGHDHGRSNGHGHGHGRSNGHGHGHGHGHGNDGNNDGKGLKINYYEKQCHLISVETTVKKIVWSKVAADPTMAAKLLRLHYHDCFVRGCDASILLDPVQNKTTEKTAGPNRSITGYDVIEEIKTKLEADCPGIVSCADILALAARDAVSFQFQKDMWPVFTGREDGRVSLAEEVSVNVPSGNANFTTLLTQFGAKGLNLNDLVTLSGAHTIGFSRCVVVARRLYNFTGIGDADPSLDATYAQKLRDICPNPQNATTKLEMDPNSSLSFDSDYFRSLNQHKGLFVSDAALLTNQQSAQITKALQKTEVFFAQFARSMVRMGAIEVLTNGQGEVRKNCRVVNDQ